jgi:predicted double-glycine peptidase
VICIKDILAERRRQVSEELGIPEDKIKIYPYRAPRGTTFPTPRQIQAAQQFMQDPELQRIITSYEIIERQEEVIEWLKESTENGKKNQSKTSLKE